VLHAEPFRPPSHELQPTPQAGELDRWMETGTMRLAFIYGAPATGKQTIGREVARLTAFKLYHNHLAVDLALALFDQFDDPHFMQLCQRIDLDDFDVAAQAQLPGIVFTYAYGGPLSDPFIDEVIRRYPREVHFVHLSCNIEELKRRVVSKERERYQKVRDPAILLHAIAAIDYAKDIVHPHHLAIDTTHLPAQAAACQIIEHFGF
jgi:hypothetical protein